MGETSRLHASGLVNGQDSWHLGVRCKLVDWMRTYIDAGLYKASEKTMHSDWSNKSYEGYKQVGS